MARPIPVLAPVSRTFFGASAGIVPAAERDGDVGAAEAARIVEDNARYVRDLTGDDGDDGALSIELSDVSGDRHELFLECEDAECGFHRAGQ